MITDLGGGFYIHCKNCGCSTFGAMHKELAIEKWNRRQSPSVTEEVVEALEFYANKENYYPEEGEIDGQVVVKARPLIEEDMGEIARKALASLRRDGGKSNG